LRLFCGQWKDEADMSQIQRYGNSKRWADVVVHGGVAYWVEVADDTSLDSRGQIAQMLAQIDTTLESINSDRTRLLQVLVYMADQNDAATLNELWDVWVPAGHPPVRAMVQVGLGGGCKVEMVVTAAVPER
jgi:enamine deaminase RidA (YjgF/YER057c/UK114 family)